MPGAGEKPIFPILARAANGDVLVNGAKIGMPGAGARQVTDETVLEVRRNNTKSTAPSQGATVSASVKVHQLYLPTVCKDR